MKIGISREHYDNGQLAFESQWYKEKRQGTAKGWYDNGQPMYEMLYHRGQLHGISKGWYIDGSSKFECYYLYNREVTQEEYQSYTKTHNTDTSEIVCSCGKKADVGCPCWWCGGKN